MVHGFCCSRRARATTLAAVAFAALALLLRAVPGADRAGLLILNAQAQAWGGAASVLSLLGLGASMLLVAALLGPARARTLAALLLLLAVGGLLVQGVKSAVTAPRPVMVMSAKELQVLGLPIRSRAMPSGHAALWGGLLAMAVCAPRRSWRMHEATRRAALSALAATACAGALARIVVGAHWPADVAAGLALGLLAGAGISGSSWGRRASRGLAALMTGRSGSRMTAALLVACATGLWVAEREYPQVEPLYAVMLAIGLLAAWPWWRWHARPAQRWPGALVAPPRRTS